MSTSRLTTTNALTSNSEMPCTTARSFDWAAWTRYAPSPFRLNAVSTTAATAIKDAIVMPATVVIGIAAFRRTWRLITCLPGIPRLTAVCTCSRSPSPRTDALVTRATIASDEIASAKAGNVRCRMLSTRPAPLPMAGNQPSFTANTRMSTIAATNAGMAAEMAVTTTVLVSSTPGRSPATSPIPIPNTRISSMASRRAKNLQRIASAGPAEAVGPGREHVGERRHRAGQFAAQHELLCRLHVRDPRQLLHGELLRPHDERCPLVRVGRAARLLERRDDLRVVEVVVVLRAAWQVECGEHRCWVRVVPVVHRQEPVDALPGLGVDEEVDVVLGGHRFEDGLEADRLSRCLVGARVRGNVRELAGRADRDRLSGGACGLHELLGLGNVLADHGRAGIGGVEHGLAVAERSRVGHPAWHQGRAPVHRVDDALPVERQRQRPAHADVAERAFEAGYDECVRRPAGPLVDPDGPAVLQ